MNFTKRNSFLFVVTIISGLTLAGCQRDNSSKTEGTVQKTTPKVDRTPDVTVKNISRAKANELLNKSRWTSECINTHGTVTTETGEIEEGKETKSTLKTDETFPISFIGQFKSAQVGQNQDFERWDEGYYIKHNCDEENMAALYLYNMQHDKTKVLKTDKAFVRTKIQSKKDQIDLLGIRFDYASLKQVLLKLNKKMEFKENKQYEVACNNPGYSAYGVKKTANNVAELMVKLSCRLVGGGESLDALVSGTAEFISENRFIWKASQMKMIYNVENEGYLIKPLNLNSVTEISFERE